MATNTTTMVWNGLNADLKTEPKPKPKAKAKPNPKAKPKIQSMEVSTKKEGSIMINGQSQELAHIRNSLIEECKDYKFQILTRTQMDEKFDEIKETNEKGSIFASIDAIKSTMNIDNTDLKRKLIHFEYQLTTKEAKAHITRVCAISGCKRKAPQKYPNNIYLCDHHKIKSAQNLKCDIDDILYKKGSEQDKKLCQELKMQYEKLCQSIATPDKYQSFDNKHLYPQDYFSVAMAKLLYIHQQISQIDEQNDGMEKLQQLVVKLIDLLIISRQNLNCHWCEILKFILQMIEVLGIDPSHIGAAFTFVYDTISDVWMTIVRFVEMVVNFISAMYRVVTTLLSWIERLVRAISAEPFVVGASAVGIGIGLVLGGPLGGLAGGLIGGGLAAMFKYG